MFRSIVLSVFVEMVSLETPILAVTRSDVGLTANADQRKLASTKSALIPANTLSVVRMPCAKLITTIKHAVIAMKATEETPWFAARDLNAQVILNAPTTLLVKTKDASIHADVLCQLSAL
jgi:hypothetical protein